MSHPMVASLAVLQAAGEYGGTSATQILHHVQLQAGRTVDLFVEHRWWTLIIVVALFGLYRMLFGRD